MPFPSDFVWGVATAAYQIEGAASEGGRRPSVWDTFCRTPGRIREGHTGEAACDHYHRFEQDFDLMANLGIRHYRFSIAWPRVLPDGRGVVNEDGVDFYRRLLDAMQRRGITPYATLFHWDSPQALEDEFGSWRSRRMAACFADYCAEVVRRLGDRIHDWMTINEIANFTHLGYGVGKIPAHAPGTVVETREEVRQTVHHALLAHGLGAQAVRAASPGPCRVGVVVDPEVCVPLVETPEHIQATAAEFRRRNGGILMPMLTGEYLAAGPPEIREGDLSTIRQPLDFVGLNIYQGHYVRAGPESLAHPPGYPRLQLEWNRLVPEAIYWGVRSVSEVYEGPILIMENGGACDDRLVAGEVIDTDRIMVLRQNLRNALRAVDEGYPLRGFFVWSLLDNFEWSWGYTRRFGLVYTDFATQKRIPKASAQWYSEVARSNRIV